MKVKFKIGFRRSGEVGPMGYLKYMGPTMFTVLAFKGNMAYEDKFECEKLTIEKRYFFRRRMKEAFSRMEPL